MSTFQGQFGLQFVSHVATGYSTRDWVDLAQFAHREGFHQVWINDNAGYRAPLAILTAIATQVPIHIGAAILVPYYHQPLDLAGSLGVLSELCDGREIGVGLARGSVAHTAHHVRVTRPLGMVRETAEFLRRTLRDGETIQYGDYPTLTDYFHLNPGGHFSLSFQPPSPFCFYGGGNGPKALAITGETMDGLISSGTFLSLVRTGRMASLIQIADAAAETLGKKKPLRRMCELNVSISSQRQEALDFPRRQVAQAVIQWEGLGFTPADYDHLSVDRQRVHEIKQQFQSGRSIQEVAALVDDDMVRACYVVGSPQEITQEIQEVCQQAATLGYDQIAFAKLGPNYQEAIQALSKRVLPALQ